MSVLRRLLLLVLQALPLLACPGPSSNVSVSIWPSAATLAAGQTQQFIPTVTVIGSGSSEVRWSVQEGDSGGTITADGLYTAPMSAGTFTVVATSVANPSKSASATVTVTRGPDVSISIFPKTASLTTNAMQTFLAEVTGSSNTAVVWTVAEPGGGTVSDAIYTAPATAGIYHLVATSVADSSKSDVATITVSNASYLSVSLSPVSAQVAAGATQSFEATVWGSSNIDVIWSVTPAEGGKLEANGSRAIFTAPSLTGSYWVTATSVFDPTRSASAAVSVVFPPPRTVSGTVSYAGTQTGRIYITLFPQSLGTSIAAPGSFTISGMPGQGSIWTSGTAFLDSIPNGRHDLAIEPIGYAHLVTSSDGTMRMTFTLTDPPPPSIPPQPVLRYVFPGPDSVVIGSHTVFEENRGPVATHLKLYWSATPNPGPQNQSRGGNRIVPADGILYLASPDVTAGRAYYFAVSALSGTLEGPVSAAIGPVTIAAATGGTTVSGTLSFPEGTERGPIIVALSSADAGTFLAGAIHTTGPRSFTIPGVAPGTYPVFVLADLNNDGLFAVGEAALGFTGNGESIEVGRSPLSGLELTVPSSNAVASVLTIHSRGSGANEYFSRKVGVVPNLKRPVRVVVSGAPDCSVPVDIGLERWGNGFHQGWLPSAVAVPVVGRTYLLDVTYEGGSKEKLAASITGMVVELPTLIAPIGTITTTTPTFSWTLPSTLPSKYVLGLDVFGGGSYWTHEMPAGTTSAVYNANGWAEPLLSGQTYSWSLSIVDANGNAGIARGQFTIQ